MKITIVLGAFFPVPPIMGGAVEKVWFGLAQEFVRHGHSVVQISRSHPRLPRSENIAGVEHIRVGGFEQPHSLLWLKFLDFLYSLRVRRALPIADILVTNTFWLPLLVRQRKFGLLYVHVARWPKGQMNWYAHAARLQAVSRVIGDAIVTQAPRLQSKVRVLPNALSLPVSASSDISRERTLLYVGRIHPEKGIELLLRAMARLPSKVLSAWRLKMIGPHETRFGGGGDSFLRKLKKLSQECGGQVEWLGPIFNEAELSAQYRAALIFVYPSLAERGEALPIAPLEAGANGCAPLVSDLACFSDYVRDGITGFVFDHRGVLGECNLARRLTDLLGLNVSDIAKIGAAARTRAEQFAVETVAPRYLDDFAGLLAQRRGSVRKSKYSG